MPASSPSDFWSRRRARVQQEAEVELRQAEAKELARRQSAAEETYADAPDEEALAALGLKDPDEMAEGDDFAAFLRSEVPERLRRRALRRLWRSNPVLANLDGLLDHDDDFTDAATVRIDMKTTYQVGKGMMQHVLALAEEAKVIAPAPAPEPAPAEADAEPDQEPAPELVEPEPVLATDAKPARDMEADPGAAARPRRMRFEFQDQMSGMS